MCSHLSDIGNDTTMNSLPVLRTLICAPVHWSAQAQHRPSVTAGRGAESSLTFSKCGTHQRMDLYFNGHLQETQSLQ